jgi:hypothetical protein
VASRREFIQVAAATVTACVTAFPAFAGSPVTLPLYKVLYDRRFDAVAAFAAEAGRSGAALSGNSGDITALWFNDLYHRWRKSPAAIAGMTSYQTWFVLDMIARDAGMRTVFRGHHQPLASGNAVHELFGPHPLLTRQATLQAAKANWATEVARIVTEFPAASVRIDKVHSTVGEARNRPVGAKTLVSWVIAAPSRV